MTAIPQPTKVKYLTNKDLLEEIHHSKNTYSEYTSEEFSKYDFIVTNLEDVTTERIEQARKKRVDDEISRKRKEAIAGGTKNPKIEIPLESVNLESIVIRLMTYNHVPLHEVTPEKTKTEADKHLKCNFPPFMHFIFKDGVFICVGKSHWKGGMENGAFCATHGKITNKLALMFMKLVDRYSHRGNWRGYCVDSTTEALTKRGWLNINEINEQDIILSYDQGYMKWSKIKSIFRSEYDGLMHKITNKTGVDMLVTPEHKLVTDQGLVKIEYLRERDNIILLGNAVQEHVSIYSDSFVELIGWILTEGHYRINKVKKTVGNITLWQNEGPDADRIRACLDSLGYKYHESKKIQYTNNVNVCFRISTADSRKITAVIPEKNLNMELILSLTTRQRQLLINTMVDGDGWRVGKNMRYVQKSKSHIDLFQALCLIAGYRSNVHFRNSVSFGKPVTYYNVNIFSKRKNRTKVENLDFHGGKRNGTKSIGKGKINHPNVPTTPYTGMVWCPETEYGCFVAKRNGTVYLTSNTYNDEMRSQALLQLSQMGLKFDESKSDIPNPFAYYTAVTNNSFTRILNLEKKSQNIRDDLLIMHGAMPSYTRQTENDIKKSETASLVVLKPTRGRKKKVD